MSEEQTTEDSDVFEWADDGDQKWLLEPAEQRHVEQCQQCQVVMRWEVVVERECGDAFNEGYITRDMSDLFIEQVERHAKKSEAGEQS